MRAEADAQALLIRTRAQIDAEKMVQEHRIQAREAESRRARSSASDSSSRFYFPPDKDMADLPSAKDTKWDMNAKSLAKHLREIVADRAPTKALGARLWGKMMELPVGEHKLDLHVWLLMKYRPWAYWTEAGFLFHPSCLTHINKELDKYDLKDHLDWVLAN